MKKRICVFCGSSASNAPRYLLPATALGTLLAERGFGLVYGGASHGIMGAVADAALAAGGEVIGVIARNVVRDEATHHGITQLQVVDDMHARKTRMAQLSQGFIALPGGTGTLEDLFEVWTWAHLGMHTKPVGLLDTNGYYRLLLQFTDHMVTEGFLHQHSRETMHVDAEPAALLDKVLANLGPQTHRESPGPCSAKPEIAVPAQR
ncbi:TIGR00730 family Rossman fold protein [Amycolatopsis keratiniphila]|uniref:Cytokinin riboside 5'-monophosphate phosphoribohydrolase n=1 Tax=Amycolatopsis keratiniphila TaxID=129921 RepID=R4SXC2_9PSEU|nr:TIGR00730 family Rossman fold protein [Amycolatopsis keratiniphila]AGM07979.1 lysine decarboxylase [Amycolatopsis keratiniphila]